MIRYFNLSTLDHFYTANYSELGCGGKGYGLEEIGFEAFSSQQSGSVPLYRYWNQTKGFHFYTTNFSELGNGGQGYVLEGTAGYVLLYSTLRHGASLSLQKVDGSTFLHD